MDPNFEKRLRSPAPSPIKHSPFRNGTASPVPTPSPTHTPTKDKYGDRYIPCRGQAKWKIDFNLKPEALNAQSPTMKRLRTEQNPENQKDSAIYNCLLKNELLGTEIDDLKNAENERPGESPGSSHSGSVFQYRITNKRHDPDSAYSVTPISAKSQKLLKSPKKPTRKISKMPYKVLDAPELQDDFYLNLVDWSSTNVLAVGLGVCVYLWSANTSQVTRLCDLSLSDDSVTSVSWCDRGNQVAVGTQKGFVQLWDVSTTTRNLSLDGHTGRVGSLAWNRDLLSSGSRDRLIIQRDTRTTDCIKKLTGHRQEVCGLRWSPDHQHLASGGNDNNLFLWNAHSTTPLQTYTDHVAAVKAIAWSPHQHGLLASGGGTADRHLRFWNTLTGQALQSYDTGSQVCNIAWSRHTNELVTTHGYSQNQILVWKYPSLTQITKLTGHTFRVLFLAMSPDGESIVTGAGDETLRFWNVFSKSANSKQPQSVLNLMTRVR